MKFYVVLALSLSFITCSSGTDESQSDRTKTEVVPVENDFVNAIESAHSKSEFLSHDALRFNLRLVFGGRERFNGEIALATNSSKGRMESRNGRIQYFDGQSAYETKPDHLDVGNRFAIYTWPYFMLFPYKLSDEGTIWEDYLQKTLNGKDYDVEQLTFTPGTGDAPDDWYIAYANPQSHLIEVAAYIVTGGKTSRAEAETDPHAIVYSDYRAVNGVQLAHRWDFRAWRKTEGLTDTLGHAALSNFQFLTEKYEFFPIPKVRLNSSKVEASMRYLHAPK